VLHKLLHTTRREHESALHKEKMALSVEIRARQDGDEQSRKLVQEAVLDGLSIELAGVLSLTHGAVLSTASRELVRLLS